MLSWDDFSRHLIRLPDLGISIDTSRMRAAHNLFDRMESRCLTALDEMAELEAGAIANPDENRMVGHYWLRNSGLAPTPELRRSIEDSLQAVKTFAKEVHEGVVGSVDGKLFTDLLIIGIGGSALGPQFVADALGTATDRLNLHFLDNTDPDGMDRVLEKLNLSQTLILVISKSGGTQETRNGMLEAMAAFEKQGLAFSAHAVAVTGVGSQLDRFASENGWLRRFEMVDWVGGRVSVTSVVGLLPAALQGLDIDQFLEGASAMDFHTRGWDVRSNPAMVLALMWYDAGDGEGARDMVILPYKDRLVLFSKYLQQLVMESLGKELDRDGNKVNQGIAVYGNKGSTDQHAYVQQLRDGLDNFFATFIEVREARSKDSIEVQPGVTSGDYLQGFLRGTRAALAENERLSMTISLPCVDARRVGALIALFERAVSFYASLVNINAYHQPGVEAGKKAATAFIEILTACRVYLESHAQTPVSSGELADACGLDPENVFHALTHLAANDGRVSVHLGDRPQDDCFTFVA